MPDTSATLPHSGEHERAVLGCVLLNPELYRELSETLRPEDFYVEKNRFIWDAMGYVLEDEGAEEIHYHSLLAVLGNRGQVDQVGGVAYLAGLDIDLPATSSAGHFAKVVCEQSTRRKLMALSSRLTAGIESGEDTVAVLDGVLAGYLKLEKDLATGGTAQHIGEIELDLEGPPRQMLGLASGLHDLDEMLMGYPAGHLALIAGRPGHGKTSLMLTMAGNMATAGAKVLIFSLEMSRQQLKMRMVAQQTGIPLGSLRRRQLSEGQRERAIEIYHGLGKFGIWIEDPAVRRLDQISARCRHMAVRKGVDVLMIDYLGLMQSRGKFESEALRIENISNGLKHLAVDLGIPVIALHQLNRDVEKRPKKMPILSDLRGSGSLEQDADSVTFVFTECKYEETPENAGMSTLVLAKNRDGETAAIEVAFDLTTQRFMSLDRDHGGIF